MTFFQIEIYDNESYLKTTERIMYTVNKNINKEEMKSDISNNNIHDNDDRVLVRICAIDMKTFNSEN